MGGLPGSRWRNLRLVTFLIAVAAFSMWWQPPESVWDADALAYLVPTAGMVVLALVRRDPRSEDAAWWLVPVCGWSIFYPFAFRPAATSEPHFASAVLTLRLLVMLAAYGVLLTLGRSFGVLPALRGVRSRGPYALVRHPVYALYIVADLCVLSLQFSPWNAAVSVSAVAAFVVRAAREERLLMADPDYRDYAARVRWRFIPWLY